MASHCTREEIERCVRRQGSIAEMMAIAQHLDDCAECRLIAAEHEEGTGAVAPRPRAAEWPLPERRTDLAALLWLGAFIALVVIAMALLLTEK